MHTLLLYYFQEKVSETNYKNREVKTTRIRSCFDTSAKIQNYFKFIVPNFKLLISDEITIIKFAYFKPR